MAAPAPPELTTDDEQMAWFAIARAWDEFAGDDSSLWPERRRQFVAGLRAQLATDNQGKAFFKAAQLVIEMLEQANQRVTETIHIGNPEECFDHPED